MFLSGVMEVQSHDSSLRAVLNFKPGGWFSGADDLHTVEGKPEWPNWLKRYLMNNKLWAFEGFIIKADAGESNSKKGEKLVFVYGRWTEFLCAVDVDSLCAVLDISNIDKIEPDASNLPKHPPLLMGAVPNSRVLWEADPKVEFKKWKTI